ncbi:class I adenylate-forming enzyme family protein [Actinoplanes sp. NPDC023936]|uniref:class I adenylate-forming enzyme family protein n=1 Tax=Actinoplanes sp. NPDC023936 TaxID=3154910 RepID=UPI0033D57E82
MTATLLPDLLDERAAATPDRPAVSSGPETLTYGRLRDRSLRVAADLHDAGIGRGDRVVVLAAHSPDTVAALYGITRLGACAVVVDEQSTDYQLAHILRDCAPAAVLTDGTAEQQCLAAARVRPLRPDGAGASAVTRTGISQDAATLIYTSGSTSMPKAVVSTHGQILFAARAIAARLRYRPDDVVLCCLPLSFDYGLYQAHLAVLAGAHLVLGSAADAGPTLLSAIHRWSATVLPAVPSLAATLVRLIDRGGEPPARLRLATNTGAALSDAMASRLRDRVPGLSVITMFGLTECKRISISEPDEDLKRPGTVGRPLDDTEAFVVDDEGRRLGPGEVGELVVRGPHVMAGYWRAPELTAQRFRRDELGLPVLHTGDRCLMDADGYLYFAGRDDDVYKQRGTRVSATEVEAAAMDIPGVELAVVLTPRGEQPARLIAAGDIDEDRLRKELRSRLDDARVPPFCHVETDLPLNGNGKVDRKALRARWEAA